MPVRNEVEALVGGIILQPHPILQRPKIMPNVQPPRRPHPAQNPGFLRVSPYRHHALLNPILGPEKQAKRDFSLHRPTGSQERTGEKSRPAPLEMTGLWSFFLLALSLQTQSPIFSPVLCEKRRAKARPLQTTNPEMGTR